MATSAEQHQAQQEALVVLLLRAIGRAFGLLDVERRDSAPQVVLMVAGLVQRFSRMSAALSADFYKRQRVSAGVRAPFVPSLPEPPSVDAVTARVVESLAPVWDDPAALDAAIAEVEQFAHETVAGAGTNTLIDAVQRDPQAKAWARVPESDPCYFCAMLASRGAVYGSKETANFRPHPGCRCNVEPVFGKYEMTAQARGYEALWAASTKSKSGEDALKAFRRAYEGRTNGATQRAALRRAA